MVSYVRMLSDCDHSYQALYLTYLDLESIVLRSEQWGRKKPHRQGGDYDDQQELHMTYINRLYVVKLPHTTK